MIKYEVIDTGVRILDIGSIERGCGEVFIGKTGCIRSRRFPDYLDSVNVVYVHGDNLLMDDQIIQDIPNVTKILDEYNKELA